MPRPKDLIQNIDFNALYRKQSARSSFGGRTASDWDRRAAQRHRTDRRSDYNKAFLSRMDLHGVQTVLDIGCGVGNLALPLARRVQRVYALDFSPEMLRYLRLQARQAGIRNIRSFQLSWTNSWAQVPKADVAICSRALGVKNLRAALRKMTRQARRRCYATIYVGGSFLSDDLLGLLDRQIAPRPDYIYAVNVLYQMGYHARVDFISSEAGRSHASADDFIAHVEWRIGSLSPRERQRVRRFYQSLPRAPEGGRRHRHAFKWAMLSWEAD